MTTFKNCFASANGKVPVGAFNSVAVNREKTYIRAPNSGSNAYVFSPIQANQIDQYIGRFDSLRSGEENHSLTVFDLKTMKLLSVHQVGDDPDVTLA